MGSLFKRLSKRTVIIAILVLIGITLAGIYFLRFSGSSGEKLEFQKGMGYVSWSKNGYMSDNSDASIAKIKELGADWMSILVTWYQTDTWSTDIHMTDKTPSDASVIRAIRKAHALGMKTMIKMHLDLLDQSDGGWRGEIACNNEADWDKWFKAYTKYLEHYVKIANKEKVDMICIGTELSSSASVKGYRWAAMIKKIRTQYKGKLTYAAHWDRYMDIRFWKELDYVGINVYFPLTDKMDPTYEELMAGWQKWVPRMEKFQKTVNKPIIFPEIGCSSADGAAIRPWEHVPRSEVNMDLQEKYYRSLFNTFWDKKWFYGVYWWYWGTNVNMGGPYNRGFTPQNKPAENVIKKWYAKHIGR